MSTSRDLVMDAVDYKPTSRLPMDLGGMLSTSISAFAYPSLVEALGLPPRRPRVVDPIQMLALPDPDVLDALGCDVDAVYAHSGVTSVFAQPEQWQPYDFAGRLPALVQNPSEFRALPDGSIENPGLKVRMPAASHVFDFEHGGQPTPDAANLEPPDIDAFITSLQQAAVMPKQAAALRDLCRRSRDRSERAIMLTGFMANISIMAHGGLAVFPMICMMHPEHIEKLHEVAVAFTVEQVEMVLDAIGPEIDIFMVNADDWGTQSALLAPPWMFERFFKPYYRRINDAIHARAPHVRTFLHSCGAIHSIIPEIAASGFDILNPVQWTAGGISCAEWKQTARESGIALWGGGVDTQGMLPNASDEALAEHVEEVVATLSEGSGYVFNAIHNLLAEVPGERIVSIYRTAAAVGQGLKPRLA